MGSTNFPLLYYCSIMEELDDLGAKFSRDRTFCFDHIIIEEIIFDETNDVTLYCSVPYYGKMYGANFGLTFAQLNTLLRSARNQGENIATALAEKLDDEDIEVPSVLELEPMFGEALEIKNCLLYTTLYEVTASVEEGDDEAEDDEDDELGTEEGMSDEETADGEAGATYEAFAFLIDEIKILNR